MYICFNCFSCFALGGPHLNEKNGHVHGSYGFHYHLTKDKSDRPTFPYGPTMLHHGCGQCHSSVCGQSPSTPNQDCIFSPSSKPTTPTIAPTNYRPTKFPSRRPSATSTSAQPTTAVDYSCLHSKSWLLNSDNNHDYSSLFSTYTDILSSYGSKSSSTWKVSCNQIPFYVRKNLTSKIVADLDDRPLAWNDFRRNYGRTSVREGSSCSFGSDIGYSGPCGFGFWPPGTSSCPRANSKTIEIPRRPAIEISGTVIKCGVLKLF